MTTKRVIDVAGAAAGVIVCAVPFGIVVILHRILMGTPLWFRQQRPGLDGKPFVLLKLQTMTQDRDERGQLLPDGHRLTAFGRFLRRTSLDELPELVHVLKGEMSLVGPRPLLMRYLDRYTPEQARRHDVKPGITGWAQVNGRNALSWEDKLDLDVWYVEHHSVWLDLKILLRTPLVVVRREGVSAVHHETIPEFLGHPAEPRTVGRAR